MEIGLYTLKYPARKAIAGVLPLLRHVDPNTISWCLLPVGMATAVVYALAASGRPSLYLAGVGLIVLRMFLGTLDGLVAMHYNKSTPRGEMVNRLAPELCDVMYLIALSSTRPAWPLLGLGVMGMGWLTSFAGMLGAVVGHSTQSVGPVGQTDRLAALIVCSLLAYWSQQARWGIDFVSVFFWWVIGGGAVTILLRLQRHFAAVTKGS